MQVRFVKGALLMGAFVLVPYSGTAFAQPPPVAPTPSIVAPIAPPADATAAPVAPPAAPVAKAAAPVMARPVAAPHGAVVVAVTDEAGPAAKALAHEVYREPTLRPSIDEATARALTGASSGASDAPAATPTPTPAADKLAEITALRGSIATSVTDITTRHLLASLGASLRADLVVAVTLDGGHAVARVLHAGTATFERVELGASVETAADGARTFVWPGAATTLRGFLPAPPAPPANTEVEATKPVAKPVATVSTRVKPELSDQRPVWKSPWFWAALGGVAAVGVTVFVLSKTTGNSPTTVHVDGSVDP
jgi:hypothetical protein